MGILGDSSGLRLRLQYFLRFQLLQASTPHPGKAAAQPAAALQPTAREVLGGDGCHGCSCS